MDWRQFFIALGSLTVGCALRAIVPYILGALNVVGEKGWKAWPPFEAKYVTSFAAAIVLYIVALLTIPNAIQALTELPLIPAISLGYSGGALVREGAKATVKSLR